MSAGVHSHGRYMTYFFCTLRSFFFSSFIYVQDLLNLFQVHLLLFVNIFYIYIISQSFIYLFIFCITSLFLWTNSMATAAEPPGGVCLFVAKLPLAGRFARILHALLPLYADDLPTSSLSLFAFALPIPLSSCSCRKRPSPALISSRAHASLLRAISYRVGIQGRRAAVNNV